MASLGLSLRLGFVRLGRLSRGFGVNGLSRWVLSFLCLIGFFLLDSGMAVMGLYLMNLKSWMGEYLFPL